MFRKFPKVSKGGLFFTPILLAACHKTAKSISQLQNVNEELPVHYKEMKRARALWKEKPETALKGNKGDYQKLLARGLEIQKTYPNHYTFYHGASSLGTLLPYLLEELAKRKGIDTPKFFKCLRMPNQVPPKFLEEVISSVQNNSLEKRDLNFLARRFMLSADICIEHDSYEKSASYFLRKDKSITHLSQVLHEILLEYEYGATKNLQLENTTLELSSQGKVLEQKMNKLGVEIWDKANSGNLFVFCIPKNLLNKDQKPEKLVYRSHTLGAKCDCHVKELDAEILVKLQMGQLGSDTWCKNDRDGIPQYRLIIPELTSQKGVLIFMLTSFTKDETYEIKQKIKSAVASYLNEPENVAAIGKNFSYGLT